MPIGLSSRFSLIAVAIASLAGCNGASKIDYTTVGRDMWQRPDLVIETLGVEPGDRVADLGAGDGYFTPHLSRAVGASGRVYAADVEQEKTDALDELCREEGLDNVDVVLAGYDDPRLPDGSIDLVLMVNSYHHIEDRPAYFRRLQTDLADAGRVAILEPNEELGGVLSLALDEGHTSVRRDVVAEMEAAGYRGVDSHDVLPVQIFEVFAPAP